MKIADRFGNELTEGQVVFWADTGLLAKVKSVDDGGLLTPDGETQPKITIEVGFKIQKANGSAVTRLPAFIITTDPAETAKVEAIIQKVAKSAVQ